MSYEQAAADFQAERDNLRAALEAIIAEGVSDDGCFCAYCNSVRLARCVLDGMTVAAPLTAPPVPDGWHWYRNGEPSPWRRFGDSE